jgi:hypothetical protein
MDEESVVRLADVIEAMGRPRAEAEESARNMVAAMQRLESSGTLDRARRIRDAHFPD